MTVSGSVGRRVKVKRFETALRIPFPFCADDTLKGHGAHWNGLTLQKQSTLTRKKLIYIYTYIYICIYIYIYTGTLLAHRFADNPWPGLYWAISHVQKLATACCLDPADFLIKRQKNWSAEKGGSCVAQPFSLWLSPQVMSKNLLTSAISQRHN